MQQTALSINDAQQTTARGQEGGGARGESIGASGVMRDLHKLHQVVAPERRHALVPLLLQRRHVVQVRPGVGEDSCRGRKQGASHWKVHTDVLVMHVDKSPIIEKGF